MNILVPIFINVGRHIERHGALTKRHLHAYVQSGYVLRGNLRVELDRKRSFEVRTGEYFSIAARQPHVIAAPYGDVHYLDLRYKMHVIPAARTSSALPGNRALQSLWSQTIKVGKICSKPIRDILEHMLYAGEMPNDTYNYLCYLRLIQLSEHIFAHSRKIFRCRSEHCSQNRVAAKLLYLLHARYRQPLSLGDLCAATGLSAGHLARMFRLETGLSIKQYLIRYRLEQAKQLMFDPATTMSLKEIAARTGFADLHQFSRAFRRRFGCSATSMLE